MLVLINHFQHINIFQYISLYLASCSVLMTEATSLWEDQEIHFPSWSAQAAPLTLLCSAAKCLSTGCQLWWPWGTHAIDCCFPVFWMLCHISSAITLTKDCRLSHLGLCICTHLWYMEPMDHYFCMMVHVTKISVLKLAGWVTRSSLTVAVESLM